MSEDKVFIKDEETGELVVKCFVCGVKMSIHEAGRHFYRHGKEGGNSELIDRAYYYAWLCSQISRMLKKDKKVEEKTKKETEKVTWVLIFEPNSTRAVVEAKIASVSKPEEYLDVVLDTGHVIRFLALGDVDTLSNLKSVMERFKEGDRGRKNPPESKTIRKDDLEWSIEMWAQDFLDYPIDDSSVYEEKDNPEFKIYRVMDVSGRTLYFRAVPTAKGELYHVSLIADTGRVHAKR